MFTVREPGPGRPRPGPMGASADVSSIPARSMRWGNSPQATGTRPDDDSDPQEGGFERSGRRGCGARNASDRVLVAGVDELPNVRALEVEEAGEAFEDLGRRAIGVDLDRPVDLRAFDVVAELVQGQQEGCKVLVLQLPGRVLQQP